MLMRPITPRRAARLSPALFLAAGLLAGAGCSSGTPRDLRGPDPEVGQVYHDEMKLTMTGGKLTATLGGVSQTAEVELSLEAVEEEEILAVTGGRVTRRRTRVLTDQGRETIRADGRAKTHTESGPLQGETVECVKAGDGWKTTLVGKAPNRRQAFELEAFPPPVSSADCYPDKLVKPGHRWTVDASKLRTFLGSGVRVESGSWERKFEKEIEVDGEPCAQIAEEFDLLGKMRDERGEWIRLEMKLTGTTRRSLRRGFSLDRRLSGTMTMTGTATEGGEKVRLTVSGPVVLEARSSRN
jgi:hypothetical protein